MTDAKSQTMLELAHAMAACAADDNDQLLGIVTAVHTRLVQRTKQGTLPGMPAAEPGPQGAEVRRQAVIRLFVYWQKHCHHEHAKLTPERGRAMVARLRDGYTETEIRKAIDGAAVGAYVSDEGHRFDDLTLICRNGSKLEQFIQRGVTATGSIPVEVDAASPVEEQITALRRDMATYKKDGRTTEYDHAAGELAKLMTKRKAAP